MKFSTTLFTLVAGLGLASRGSAILINGSFENPIVPSGGYTNFPGGSTSITGWTVVGVDSSVVNGSFTQSGIVFNAQNGNQWIDLAGITSNSSSSGVTQNVATSIGTTYKLTFFVGSSTDHSLFFPCTIDLSINGGTRVGYTNPNAPTNHLDWMQFDVLFTATTATTSIAFLNGCAPNNYESALDNVSMQVVPEPVSMTVMAVGIAAIMRRRRKS